MGLQRNIFALLTAAFAWRVAKFVHSTGELRELNNILASSGRCKRVHADFHGYEDFAVFEDGGMVVFASDHAHFAFNFGTSMRQAIAAKEPEPPHVLGLFNGGEWHPLHLSGAPSDFHPHGLAARGNLRGNGELLVVNHRSTHDTLELFAVEDGGRTLRHSRTESHELMFNLNDCVFRGGEPEVYCTNWRSYETGTIQDAVEVYGQRPWSYVVRCHLLEHTCEKVADGIKMANGIEMRGSHVIVVSSLEPAILVYSETDGGPLALPRVGDAEIAEVRMRAATSQLRRRVAAMKHWSLPSRSTHEDGGRCCARGRPRRGGSGGEVIQEIWAPAPRLRAQRSIVAFVGGAPPAVM